MSRYLPRLARPGFKITLVLVVLLSLLGTGASLYGYALYQWHAAQRAVKEDRPEEALDRLKICLILWPRSVPVHLLAARAARQSMDFTNAEDHLNLCLKLESGATEAIQLEFLLMRAQTGEEDKVWPALLSYIDSGHAETPLILETMARAYMHNLRYGPAYAVLTRWIGAEPASAKPLWWRGWVLEHMDNPPEAMEDYKHALELDPDLYAVRLRVAEMLLEDNRPKEAQPHLETLIQQHPENTDIPIRLAHCRYLQGEVAEARRLFEAAVKQKPNDVPSLHFLAKIELHDGRTAEAEKWLRQALKVDPSDVEALYTLHNALQLEKRDQDAAVVLEQYEKKSALLRRINELLKTEAKQPITDPDVLFELGKLLMDIERPTQGLYRLEQALLRDPWHKPSLQLMAEYHENNGDSETAATFRSRLLAANRRGQGTPRNPAPVAPAGNVKQRKPEDK
jgi:tetratricopeptide (TPR) repeat protein